MEKILHDVAELQRAYRKLKRTDERLTKEKIGELVIPFRDAYKLTDIQALMVAREQMSLIEINDLLNT